MPLKPARRSGPAAFRCGLKSPPGSSLFSRESKTPLPEPVESQACLRTLSKRAAPVILVDERGYQESRLLTGFSCVVLCVDPTDNIEVIREQMQTIEGIFHPVTFEYYGRLHYGWQVCLLEPRPHPSEDLQ